MNVLVLIIILLLVFVAVVAAVVSWFVKGQNNLVHSDELCSNALSQIGVQQQSRWDALNTLADLTKAYSAQEYDTLMGVIHARQGVTGKSTAADVDNQEALLQGGVSRINALAEAYPDLKSNTVYLQTMGEVKSYEEKVRMSRMVYNDSVTKFNRLVRSLPGSLLANGLGFAPREYLQENPETAAMPVLV